MSMTHTTLPKTFAFVRSFQGIDEFVLSNGLKVLFFEDPSQGNLTVNITYLVGSRHEGRGEAGMAHLLEHMLFKGTASVKDIKGVLQDKGASFNATTWFDRTNYFATFTPDPKNLEFALKLEADRMLNSLILAEDLESEMTVVRNEFEMGENNPVHVLHDQLMSAAFRWHNYGKTTIGNRSDIERVPVKSLRHFYEHYYQPDNAVLVVAGLFDRRLALDLIDRYFGVLARPNRILDKTYTQEPAQDGPREVVLERVGDMASVGVGYHIPASSHQDHAAIRVFIDAINDEPGGLLYKALVETGLCSELFGITYFLYEPGMALCFTRPTKDDQALLIREKLLELIELKAALSLDEQQVARIKARMLKRFKLVMTSSKDVALKLSEAIACGDWRLFFWQRQQVEAVSFADVVRVAQKYFVRSNRTSGVFLPQKEAERVTIEHVAEVSEVVANIREDSALRAGEAFEASAQNIERLVSRKEQGQQKSAILPKKTRGESVHARLLLHYGNELTLNPYREEFAILPGLMWRGTKNYDFQSFRDRLDALMSALDLSGAIGRLSASIKSERVNISDTLELVAEMFARPALKESEFLIVKQREMDDFEEVKNDPQRLGFQELERLKNPWPKDSIHYVPSFEERISALKELSLPRIKEAYNAVFASDNWSFALVGDADGDLLLDKMPEYFGEPKTKVPYERIKRPFIANVPQELSLNTPDKEMAIIAMAFNFPMRDDHEEYPAIKLANYIFGETMNSRLMLRIREKEGISYGAGSWLETSRYEENSSINFYAMASPASVSRARLAMIEEWQRFLDGGPMDDELKNAKESLLLSFQNLLSSDSYVVSTLAADLESGRNFLWRERLFAKMAALSADDIKKAAFNFWNNASFSIVTAGDQAKFK